MWMCAAPGLVLGVLLAPAAILTFVLATLPLGMRVVLPSLWLLGAVFQRTLRTALLGPVRSDKFAMRMAAPAEAMSMTSATRSGETVVSARSRHARSLFAGIAMSYERVATLLSLGQDPLWRRALVESVAAQPEDRVLDVATGTGMVARALVSCYGCQVIGLDQSADMLAAGSADGRPLVRAQGERLPFADDSFDHITFTYLLRYVDDPAATICELARVVRPGGRVATLEFGVPANPIWRYLWRLYTRIGLPLAGRLLSPSWGTVGDFLGPSIEHFYAVHSQAKLECKDEVRVGPVVIRGGGPQAPPTRISSLRHSRCAAGCGVRFRDRAVPLGPRLCPGLGSVPCRCHRLRSRRPAALHRPGRPGCGAAQPGAAPSV